MANEPRGSVSAAYASRENDVLAFTRWKDNSTVTVASTLYDNVGHAAVKRWSRSEKKKEN